MLTTNSFKSPLIEFVVLVVGQELCLLQKENKVKLQVSLMSPQLITYPNIKGQEIKLLNRFNAKTYKLLSTLWSK